MTTASAVEPARVAGEPGVRYQIDLGAHILVEWKFAHRDWLFVAGALCHRRDNIGKLVDLSRQILATWSWIDEPTSSLPTITPSPLWSTADSHGPPEAPAAS